MATNYFKKNWRADSFVPGDMDVLVGRGKLCYGHSGNIRLNKIVESYLESYSAADSTKRSKSEIIKRIVDQIREDSPEGGFVKKDPATGKYYECGDVVSREKVSQCFRDALKDSYKSSNKAKTLKRSKERQLKKSMREAGVSPEGSAAAMAENAMGGKQGAPLNGVKNKGSSSLVSMAMQGMRDHLAAVPAEGFPLMQMQQANVADSILGSNSGVVDPVALRLAALMYQKNQRTVEDIILQRAQMRLAFQSLQGFE